MTGVPRHLVPVMCLAAVVAMAAVVFALVQVGSRQPAEHTALAARQGFALRSPEVIDGGQLPRDFTGDGNSSTLPLEWSGVPEGTRSFAVIMHHVAPDRTKWYWILYNIPADTSRLPRNATGVGILGSNSVNGRTEYAPPHSKGPGPRTYVYTVYALSEPVKLAVSASEVSRDVLLAAMKDNILASAELRVVYSRDARPDVPPECLVSPGAAQ